MTSQDKMRESGPHDRTRLDGWVKTSLLVNSRWKSQILMTGQDRMDESRLHDKSRQDERVRSSWQDKKGMMSQVFMTSQDKVRESGSRDRTRQDGWVKTSWQVKTRWEESGPHDRTIEESRLNDLPLPERFDKTYVKTERRGSRLNDFPGLENAKRYSVPPPPFPV